MWMKRMSRAGIIIRRAFIVFLGTLFMVLLAVAGVVYVILCGPSESAQELLTRSLKETSAVGFIPDLFLPEQRVSEIMAITEITPEMEGTDTSLVTIAATKKESGGQDGEADGGGEEKEIEFAEITGASYRGIMMLVKDPTRIFVGTPSEFGGKGLTLAEMVEKYDAIGGVNGGGFSDPNGMGNGGIPQGIVITDGRLVWGGKGTMSYVIGFDQEGILHVGYMSGQEAMDRNIQWACSYGPALIVNGEPVDDSKIIVSGINPRTAIGQRADGTVLLLVVDGRQITSLGASYEDLISIMLEYGAVNAANLDGGSSTQMIYEDETLNINASVKGTRPLPTTILVRKQEVAGN